MYNIFDRIDRRKNMKKNESSASRFVELKKKYFENGISSLTFEEVLELLLMFSDSRVDASGLAKKLSSTFGSLRTVFEAPRVSLKDMGLKVCLKPMVDCLDGVWRAHVSFPMDVMTFWDKWFESYTAFMCHYARIAEINGCEMLCTGCEMAGMDAVTDHCRKMIEKVRGIYHGKLMHNINHGDELDFEWLSDVDVIGISAYYAVTDGEHVSADDMRKGWAGVMKTVDACHRKYQRPVMFAEIGMRSEHGCSAYPYDYRPKAEKGLSLEEQSDFYRTAMEATWELPWFAGYFWWDQVAAYRWPYDPKTDVGFGIFGKPAEETLKEFYLTK